MWLREQWLILISCISFCCYVLTHFRRCLWLCGCSVMHGVIHIQIYTAHHCCISLIYCSHGVALSCVHLGIVSLYVYCTHRWGICLSGGAEENRGDVMCIMLFLFYLCIASHSSYLPWFMNCVYCCDSYLSIHLSIYYIYMMLILS